MVDSVKRRNRIPFAFGVKMDGFVLQPKKLHFVNYRTNSHTYHVVIFPRGMKMASENFVYLAFWLNRQGGKGLL